MEDSAGHVKHNTENGLALGLAAAVSEMLFARGWLSTQSEVLVAVIALGFVGSALAKLSREAKLRQRIGTKLGSWIGPALALIYLTGCAGSLGTVTPVLLTAEMEGGQLVSEVYFETKGLQWTNGYAVVGGDENGASALEGGNISENGGSIITDTITGLGRVLGALLSPFGAASDALEVR